MSDDWKQQRLYVAWLEETRAHDASEERFRQFMRDNLSAQSVAAAGSAVTVLYSGDLGGEHTYKIAQDLAERSDGMIRIIDNTEMGRFLNGMLYTKEGKDALDFPPAHDFVQDCFLETSAKFALETEGPVITITSRSRAEGVFNQAEIDGLMHSKATSINGVPIGHIIAESQKFEHPDVRHAYLKAFIDGAFARAMSKDEDAAVLREIAGERSGAVLDLSGSVLRDLAEQPIPLRPVAADGYLLQSDAASLRGEFAAARARALLTASVLVDAIDDPMRGLDEVGADIFSEPEKFQSTRTELSEMIIELDGVVPLEQREMPQSLDLFLADYRSMFPKSGRAGSLQASVMQDWPEHSQEMGEPVIVEVGVLQNQSADLDALSNELRSLASTEWNDRTAKLREAAETFVAEWEPGSVDDDRIERIADTFSYIDEKLAEARVDVQRTLRSQLMAHPLDPPLSASDQRDMIAEAMLVTRDDPNEILAARQQMYRAVEPVSEEVTRDVDLPIEMSR